jgi:hypothetical protein
MPDTGLTDGVADFDSAFWEANGRKQVIAQLASASLPAAATEGRVFADTTNNLFKVDTGAALVSFGGWGAWESFTPTWTNFTVGNGSVLKSHYCRSGNRCLVYWVVSLGSTSSVSGVITSSLPFTQANTTGYDARGHALFYDATGPARYPGVLIAASATVQFLALNAAGTYLATAATSSTVPFTWATGDVFSAPYEFEVA